MAVQNRSVKSLTRYQTPFLLDFETDFDGLASTRWFQNHFYVALYSTVVYCIVIFLLHSYMKGRKRLELRRSVIAWNFSLALFHMAVIARVIPDVIYDIYHYGYEFTLCDSSWLNACSASSRWTRLFINSKIVEFGDTVFLVLRKRPLTVLHVYHHITVVLSIYYLAAKPTGPGRYAPMINGTIHTVMYTYFTIKMLGYRVPKWISIMITSAQIIQMFYGIFMFTKINLIVADGRPCDMVIADTRLATVIGITYAALFMNYFYQTYIKKSAIKLEHKKLK